MSFQEMGKAFVGFYYPAFAEGNKPKGVIFKKILRPG
jgi:hypothetical protein